MDRFVEQPKFEIQPVIEQRPFENSAVQAFFAKWCEINDSIQPQMVDRDEWEKRGIKGVLEKRADGKQTLFIPKDLQLWEMVGVMEVVDNDTFAAKPELRTEAKDKLLALGKIFHNAGSYIAQRVKGIHEGREMAEALALEFYEYGQSLVEGKRPEMPLDIDDIAAQNLTPEETETVDRFLAGNTLHESRQKRVGKEITEESSKKDVAYESGRQKTLVQFFRVAEKAFALENKSVNGELQKNPTKLKPWQNDTPIHSAFLARTEKMLAQKIETPKREFEMALFRRGLEKLTDEMRERGWKHAVNIFFENLGLDLRIEQKKLLAVLHIPVLKAELETIRQTGSPAKISQKEREIADKIQRAVSGFPLQQDANNPAEIVANQYINCVGASTLGGALMREAGLNYLVGDMPEHSITLLITNDGKVEWRDMLNDSFNGKLSNEMVEGCKKDGTPLTIEDIVVFAHKPTKEGLMFDINRDKKEFIWVKKGQRQYITLFEPEYGQQIQILNNTGCILAKLGRNEEALEAYQQAVALDPKYAYPYNGLGNSLLKLGREEEAIKAYRQAVALDPKGINPYKGLCAALLQLGRNKEAIEAYRQVVDLADKKNENDWIKETERVIAELKE